MTPDQLRDHLARLGLTQAGAARFLGYSDRQVRSWMGGQAEIPRAVALLLEKLTPEDVK